MTVYDLLSRVREDERHDQLMKPVNVLAQHFPGVFTGPYEGRPGEELDTVERELGHIQRISDELAEIADGLPELALAAEEERRRRRGRLVLLGLLVTVVVVILVVQGIL